MNNKTSLKLVCGKTGEVFTMTNWRIENNNVIYSKNLDAPLKIGDQMIKTWEDGYEEKFSVLSFKKLNNLQSSLQIFIK